MGTRTDAVALCLIRVAARIGPADLVVRLEEEWSSTLAEQSGAMPRLMFALGCCRAAAVIGRGRFMVPVAQTRPAIREEHMTVPVARGLSRLSHAGSAAASGAVLCDINTTPLIDVMLVLLITLIVSLPILTHAVKIDLPRQPPPVTSPPAVIDLAIEFDGTVIWNGTPVAGEQQLERYFSIEARSSPQPEVHVRPDPRVKYDFVARVLASAQRTGIHRLGIASGT